jgi:2-dehydropantoate 2-reductase
MATLCIYGAGSIGCYLGGRLLAAGSDVTFIGRSRVGDELHQHGLALSSFHGKHGQVEPPNIRFSIDASAPGAIVISFQNGLSNAEVLRAALPRHTVLEGMVPFNVVSRGPGAFHQGTGGELEVKASPGLQPFVQDFARAGLPLIQHADMLPVQWAKLLLNLNNAINALANRPLKEELSQRAYRRCLAMAQEEALRLLSRAGIRPAKLTPLPATWIPRMLSLPDGLFARVAGKMLAIDPLARSSMSDDLAAGRATEVDWISGEVVRLAERLGRTAPVNARLCALVHAAEQSAERPAWSGGALLEELRRAIQ